MSHSVKSEDIEKEVRKLIAEVLETEPDTIASDASFVKDLGMDSMMALEILAGIEKKYKVSVPEDLLAQFTDVNKTVEIVENLIKAK